MDRGNRVVWTALGVVLVLVGAGVAAAGLGWLPHVDRGTVLLAPVFLRRWRQWGAWAWWGVLVAGLVVAAAGLALARAQLRRRTGRPIADLTNPGPNRPSAAGGPAAPGRTAPGRTTVRSGALTHGLAGDLGRHPRVRRAAVAVSGEAPEPRLYARLDVKAGSDLAALHRHVAGSLTRFTTTTGLRPADVQILVQVRDTADRVR